MTPVEVRTGFLPVPSNSFAISASRPIRMVAALILADAVALLLSVGISVLCKYFWLGDLQVEGYLRLLPFLFVFLAVYAVLGLYSDVSVSTPEELRRATYSSVLLFVVLAPATVSFRNASRSITLTLVLAVILAVALVPLSRAIARGFLARRDWWGYPAVVFGSGPASRSMVAAMLKDPGFGLKPRAVVDDEHTGPSSYHGIPVLGSEQVARVLRETGHKAYAVMVMPETSHRRLSRLMEHHGSVFSHVLVLPELLYYCCHAATSKSVGGRWGLELRNQELDQWRLRLKRALDLTLLLAALPLLLPVVIAIAVVVKLSSDGPIFYSQKRIGRGGRIFKAWKFRTMFTNADAVLQQYLDNDVAMRREWELTRKLKNDPRVTSVGAVLRRLSLDELPQLWNVVRGEMSLVGPRPIVNSEVPLYGDAFTLYKQMPAGLTGLWQVSGRNDTSYEERVSLDSFYARNWSVWLDLYILSRTIGAVLSRSGAY